MNVSTKLFFISFLLNIVSLSTYSQTTELLGNLEVYANDNLGSIIHIDSASKKIKIGKDYHRNNWSSFTLVKANDGYYYGIRTTPNREAVVIYRVDATKGESQEIHQFSFPGNSMDVTSSLIEAAPGELWGQLANCGINNKGVIYSYNYITDSAKVEFHLDSINSDYPIGGLTKASNGKIYGVSRDIRSGTNAKVGSIYEIDLTSHTITNRFTFSSSAMKGVYPGTQLVEAANGMLYGICSLGGSINGSGTLFEYNPNTHTVWKRKQFINTSTIGDLPIPRLFPAANGKFYGATSNGGVYGHGSIFEFDTITNQVTDIYDKDSSMAVAHITHEDSNGRLIGYSADNNSYSSIFSFDRAQSQISSLFDFNRDDYSLFIYKDSVNRYIAGGKIVVSFDSLFNNYEVITKGGQCMDGGRIRDPLTKASNGWFYGHSKSSTYEPVLIRYNPVNYKFDVVKIFLPKDSMYNITGPFVEHPNGNLYAPISSEWNAFREMPYPQILELNPANDSLSVVYQFPYKFLDIRSLKVDANGNFYGIANGGMVNSSGNQQSGKYFFTVNNQLDSTRTIYRIFNSNFSQTDIAVKDSLVLGLYNSTSPKLFKYNINLDTIVFRSLNGNNVRSHLIQGNGGLYYGLMDEKIVSINVNNFQQNTVIDFANNPSIAGREPMTLSYGNGRLYGYNKRSPSSYNKNSIFSIDPLIGISSLELIQEIDSTEGAVLGGYNYGQIGANPQLIKVCRPSSKPELSLNDDTICPGGSVKLIAGLDNLNSGYAWELYEGNKTNLISTDTSGVFNISPDSTTWYYLKGVGSCFTQAPYDSVRIVVDSNFVKSDFNNTTICMYQDFIKPNNDTLFNVTNSFTDTTYFSSITACDSIVITRVTVDTVNVQLSQNHTTLTSLNTNASSYSWFDCTNDTLMNVSSVSCTAPYNGSFAVVVTENSCQDTSACVPILTVNSDEIGSLNKVTISPNPTFGKVKLNLIEAETIEVRVRNPQGKLISTQFFAKEKKLNIDIDGPVGVYFLEIVNEKGEKNFWKVVKE